jgi:hypothetical protein
MSGKRRHKEREAQFREREQRAKRDALARGVAVDPAALAPHNSYGQPDFVSRGYYVDQPFACRACGVPQIWTAAQQKWWYEVARGPVFSTARLCRSCRQQERQRREAARRTGGDPNPYKNARLLLARVRSELEPDLQSAGYQLVARNPPGARRALFLDFARPGELLSISWDQHEARLAAAWLTEGSVDVRVIATAELSGTRSTFEIDDRLAPFVASVRRFVVFHRGSQGNR